VIARLLAAVAVALALAGPAAACAHPKTSLSYLEGQIMCPTCHTTLDMSESPAAQAIKAEISQRVSECWTSKQIENELVANFGQGILAAPPHKGFDLLAWWLPIAAVLLGAAVIAVAVWRWTRTRDPDPDPGDGPDDAPVDAELDRRIDDLLARMD
jgi:cytochrome c-type biogenesis protein CcmH